MVSGVGEMGRGLVTAKEREETSGGNGNILYVDSGGGYMTIVVKKNPLLRRVNYAIRKYLSINSSLF